jgi:TPR repeat protein
MSLGDKSAVLGSASAEFTPLVAHRLSLAAWFARSAGLLTVFFFYAFFSVATNTRTSLKAGLPSWTVDCETSVQRLKHYRGFEIELSNSFVTPSEPNCRERMAEQGADALTGVAYAVALAHRGARSEALAVFEREAASGKTEAVNALASLYLRPVFAKRFSVSEPIDKALALLRRHGYKPNADSYFLLFKALNQSQSAENGMDAALNLLRSISLNSVEALGYVDTTLIDIPGTQTSLMPVTKKTLKTILRELQLTKATDDNLWTLEDYFAFIEYIRAKPEVRDNGCIVSKQLTVCPGAWRWRFLNLIGRARIDRAHSLEELSDILIFTAVTILDMPEDKRTPDVLRSIKSTPSLTYAIGALYAAQKLKTPSGTIDECDELTAHRYDPFRVGNPVEFEKIDPKRAIAACNRAIAQQGMLPHLLFQRGRAFKRAEQIAAVAKDTNAVQRNATAGQVDYEAAAKSGYPMAFNNLASILAEREGEQSLDRAASLHVEALNHTLNCCWPTVAQLLLEQKQTLGEARTQRVVRTLTSWSAALGNAEAKRLLASIGENSPVAAAFTDTPPWLRGR